jgi:peptide deformylase
MAGETVLHTATEKFDFQNPPMDPIELAKKLAEAVIEHNGLGLSANQLGLPYRAFVIKANPVVACFNPIIVDRGDEVVYLEEGCLSYPGLSIKVKRPKNIKVRFTQPNGEVVTRTYAGITARIFQHELDHLDGISHVDRATAFHREQAVKNVKKMQNPKKVAQLHRRAQASMERISTAMNTNVDSSTKTW